MDARFTLPSYVRIGPFKYDIKIDRNTIIVHDDGDATTHGMICHADQTIYIAENFPPSYMRWVLLHECLHGVMFHSGINDSYKKHNEEEMVRYAGAALLALLRDNPMLVAFLTAEDDNGAQEQEGVRGEESGTVSEGREAAQAEHGE